MNYDITTHIDLILIHQIYLHIVRSKKINNIDQQNPKFMRIIMHGTFAIRLALLYLIIRSNPAINAMPNSTPRKIPKNKPILQTPSMQKFIKKIKVDEKDHRHANQQHNGEAKLETYNGV
jgi:hypothetical protein